ncbi:hypothetical protein K9M41_01160 [Candidatus Gracilibacteria bacterium]|nr:hypothetical protein [Candidatus Gracilibacteria bacterium]
MKAKFFSSDFGALVLGREVLVKYPEAELEFSVKDLGIKKKDFLGEIDFWSISLEKIVAEKTKFGRIGILYDRTNKEILEFIKKLDSQKFNFERKDRRAEKTPQFISFETQIIHHLANEGWADTVEFRRIARKFLRKAKNFNCDTVFFCETIFGEEKTKKILQHLAGTQIKIFTPNDFLLDHPEFNQKTSNTKRKITIETGDKPEFTNLRAEKILRTKLKK